MNPSKTRKLFVNVAVKELARSKAFFSELGFAFEPKFTDEKAACMILSTEAWVMLLEQPFFQGFVPAKRELCDTSKATEALLCISCESKAEVDAFTDRALAIGAKPAMPTMDHGFMYARSFYDVDGHHWEIMWMDPKAAAEGPPKDAS